MSVLRSSIAFLIVGLLLGTVLGLFIARGVEPSADELWSLIGSAGGAIVAIASGIWLFHYQQNEGEKAERRRIKSLIDGALIHVEAFYRAERESSPRFTDMATEMDLMVQEYRIVLDAVRKVQHTSGEIARASKYLGTHVPDEVEMIGDSSELRRPGCARSTVAGLEQSLRDARSELRV